MPNAAPRAHSNGRCVYIVYAVNNAPPATRELTLNAMMPSASDSPHGAEITSLSAVRLDPNDTFWPATELFCESYTLTVIVAWATPFATATPSLVVTADVDALTMLAKTDDEELLLLTAAAADDDEEDTIALLLLLLVPTAIDDDGEEETAPLLLLLLLYTKDEEKGEEEEEGVASRVKSHGVHGTPVCPCTDVASTTMVVGGVTERTTPTK